MFLRTGTKLRGTVVDRPCTTPLTWDTPGKHGNIINPFTVESCVFPVTTVVFLQILHIFRYSAADPEGLLQVRRPLLHERHGH